MRLRRRVYQSPPRVRQNIRPANRGQSNQNQINQNQSNPQPANQNPANQEEHHVRHDVTLRDALDKLYTDIDSVPSFSAKINDFLRQNSLHSVHKRIVKKNFPRRRIIARFPNDIWMGDLIEYPQFKFNNRQYVYILVLIDCFTKKVFIAPMKDKSMKWSVAAFESIFSKLDEFPTHLITDGGLGKSIEIKHCPYF